MTASTRSRRVRSTVSASVPVGTTGTPAIPDNGDDFDHFLAHMQGDFLATTGTSPLFETNAAGLYDAYLAGFPAAERQHYRCNCCEQFIERYGHLVRIDEMGLVSSAFWNAAMPKCFAAMEQLVLKAKITGVFKSSDATWGTLNNQAKPSAAWPT